MIQIVIPTIKSSVNPTVNENISSGYPLGQHWFNTVTGDEYLHESDGVWSTKTTYIVTGDTYINSGGTEPVFVNDMTVSLMGVKTFGKYANGSVIPSAGKTAREVIADAIVEYLSPSFSSFTSNLLSTYEVASILPTNVLFYLSYNNAQNILPNTLGVYDITNSNYRAQNQSIVSSLNVNIGNIQKQTNGSINQWRSTALNTNNAEFSSPTLTVTWRFKVFHGMVDSFPENSTDVRNMTQQWDNVNQFQIRLDKLKYTIALPSGKNIVSIITQNNEPIKTNFIKRESQMSITLGDGVSTTLYDIYDFETATIMNLYANVILS